MKNFQLSRPIFALVTSFLLAAVVVVRAQEECACTFTDTDPSDCRVYGQIGDQVLIPWYKASQECLDVFNIKDEAIDPATVESIFPEPGSPANVNALQSYLRFNSGTVATGIKLSLVDFFVETNPAGGAEFAEEIVVDGETINCENQASACWDAVKAYLNDNPDVTADIGDTLYNQQRLSKEKEQSLVRIRLCSDGPTDECAELSDQVQEKMQETADDTACSAYGLGPGSRDLPFCGGATGSGSGNTTSSGTGSDSGTGSGSGSDTGSGSDNGTGSGSELVRISCSGVMLVILAVHQLL